MEKIVEKIEITYVFPNLNGFKIIGYEGFKAWYNESEPETKKWMSNNIRNDWNIIDAGANVGMYTLPFSVLASDGKIFAFEPTDTIEMLRENLKRHGCLNVILNNSPLGSKTERKQDNIYKIWGDVPEQKSYSFTTIDDFFLEQKIERLDLIKIDVDSYDYEVLLGSEKVLEKYNPYVIVELNHALFLRKHTPQEAIQWMIERGYGQPICFDRENYLFRR